MPSTSSARAFGVQVFVELMLVVGLAVVLLSIPAVSNLIREGKTFQIPSIMQTNRKTGMVMLNDALLELVEQRVVEPREAYLKAVEKASFASALKAKRIDTAFLSEGL